MVKCLLSRCLDVYRDSSRFILRCQHRHLVCGHYHILVAMSLGILMSGFQDFFLFFSDVLKWLSVHVWFWFKNQQLVTNTSIYFIVSKKQIHHFSLKIYIHVFAPFTELTGCLKRPASACKVLVKSLGLQRDWKQMPVSK